MSADKNHPFGPYLDFSSEKVRHWKYAAQILSVVAGGGIGLYAVLSSVASGQVFGLTMGIIGVLFAMLESGSFAIAFNKNEQSKHAQTKKIYHDFFDKDFRNYWQARQKRPDVYRFDGKDHPHRQKLYQLKTKKDFKAWVITIAIGCLNLVYIWSIGSNFFTKFSSMSSFFAKQFSALHLNFFGGAISLVVVLAGLYALVQATSRIFNAFNSKESLVSLFHNWALKKHKILSVDEHAEQGFGQTRQEELEEQTKEAVKALEKAFESEEVSIQGALEKKTKDAPKEISIEDSFKNVLTELASNHDKISDPSFKKLVSKIDASAVKDHGEKVPVASDIKKIIEHFKMLATEEKAVEKVAQDKQDDIIQALVRLTKHFGDEHGSSVSLEKVSKMAQDCFKMAKVMQQSSGAYERYFVQLLKKDCKTPEDKQKINENKEEVLQALADYCFMTIMTLGAEEAVHSHDGLGKKSAILFPQSSRYMLDAATKVLKGLNKEHKIRPKLEVSEIACRVEKDTIPHIALSFKSVKVPPKWEASEIACKVKTDTIPDIAHGLKSAYKMPDELFDAITSGQMLWKVKKRNEGDNVFSLCLVGDETKKTHSSWKRRAWDLPEDFRDHLNALGKRRQFDRYKKINGRKLTWAEISSGLGIILLGASLVLNPDIGLFQVPQEALYIVLGVCFLLTLFIASGIFHQTVRPNIKRTAEDTQQDKVNHLSRYYGFSQLYTILGVLIGLSAAVGILGVALILLVPSFSLSTETLVASISAVVLSGILLSLFIITKVRQEKDRIALMEHTDRETNAKDPGHLLTKSVLERFAAAIDLALKVIYLAKDLGHKRRFEEFKRIKESLPKGYQNHIEGLQEGFKNGCEALKSDLRAKKITPLDFNRAVQRLKVKFSSFLLPLTLKKGFDNADVNFSSAWQSPLTSSESLKKKFFSSSESLASLSEESDQDPGVANTL